MSLFTGPLGNAIRVCPDHVIRVLDCALRVCPDHVIRVLDCALDGAPATLIAQSRLCGEAAR